MTNTMWELYWLTRVIDLHELSELFTGLSLLSVIASLYACGMFSKDERDVPRRFKSCLKIIIPIFVVSLLINTFTPTKEEVAFIIAGGAVVSAAQSDAGQRIANKSVAVLEGSLDTILGKEAVAKAQLDVEKRVISVVKNQMGITDESKGSEKAAGNAK